jgi:hypothetical protein
VHNEVKGYCAMHNDCSRGRPLVCSDGRWNIIHGTGFSGFAKNQVAVATNMTRF